MAAIFKLLKKTKLTNDTIVIQNEKKEIIHGGHDDSNWLVSYADMMTLLCGFFIMLFSMAKLDAPQYDGFKEALAKQFGGEYIPGGKQTAKFMTQILQEMGILDQVIMKSDYTGVEIIFQSTVFFDTLSSAISDKGKKILEELAKKIITRETAEKRKYKIVIEGHSDSRPVLSGIYPSNWELSGARSARVARLFIENGFEKERLTAISYSDAFPVVPERKPTGEFDEESLSKNRRVVIRILEPKQDSIPFPNQLTP
ncbi:MAG: OmpA family protein [Bdellovibrio sp.]|nr:OmpA family protein [Bdellovibrio sp.]